MTRRRLLGTAAFAGTMVSLTQPARVALLALDGPQVGATFALIEQSSPAGILIDEGADTSVQHVADSFASDLERVSAAALRRYVGGQAMVGRSS
ncbi:MAG: hypothetical protein KGJ57_22385 [Sphingomonadales bacterium]|nr:hypothetical protein [Sphingomonadales bacterium]MDE2172134.1 hypothetical protein [Sphingomonadales bacterium]